MRKAREISLVADVLSQLQVATLILMTASAGLLASGTGFKNIVGESNSCRLKKFNISRSETKYV